MLVRISHNRRQLASWLRDAYLLALCLGVLPRSILKLGVLQYHEDILGRELANILWLDLEVGEPAEGRVAPHNV